MNYDFNFTPPENLPPGAMLADDEGSGSPWGVVLTQNLRESSRSFRGRFPVGGARHREAHRRTLANKSVPPPSQYNDTGSIDGGDMDEGAGASPCNAPSVTHPTHLFSTPRSL